MAMRVFRKHLGVKRAGALAQGLQSRAFSSDGRVLSDEERAAENMYIKKMEKEKLEKAKQMAAKHGESEAGGSSAAGSSISEPSKDSSKKFAIAAGLAAVLGVGWWYSSSGAKKQEEKK